MDAFVSESIKEYAHLVSNDEKIFYNLVASYFYERANEYHGRYTIVFFSGDQGVFEITSKTSFKTAKELEQFHENVGRRDYHLFLGQYERGFELTFNGLFQGAVEVFGNTRRVVHCIYDQELKDIMEGKKKRPPRTSAFRDMILGKIAGMIAESEAAEKRKYVS